MTPAAVTHAARRHATILYVVMACAAIACFTSATVAVRARAQQSVGGPGTLAGLLSTGTLNPPLVNDVTRLKFSPDGNYILAQDDSSIFILSRQGFAVMLHIDAPSAGPAQFTPDSGNVVFSTGSAHLRIERWSLNERKRTSTQEVMLAGGCVRTLLSPDGKTLACFSERADSKAPQPVSAVDLLIVEVATGDVIATKQAFLPANYESLPVLSAAEAEARQGVSSMISAVPAGFSPDSHYFAAAFGRQEIAVDLDAHEAIALRGDLEWMLEGGFAFLSGNRVIVENRGVADKSEIFDFPSGAITDTVTLGDQQIEAATRGDYLFLRPIKAAPVGVFDWKTRKMVAALRQPAAVDIYDRYAVTQTPDGQIALYDFPEMKTEATLALPADALGEAWPANISPDFSWIAISNRSRGAIWNVSEMKRRFFLRGFTGVYFDGDDALYADLPRQADTPRSMIRAGLSPETENVSTARVIDEQGTQIMQYGRYMLATIPLPDNPLGFSLDVKDARDGHALWTMNFPKLAPSHIEISPDENHIVFRWLAKEKPAMDQIKKDKALYARYEKATEHVSSFLLQVLGASTGKTEGNILVEAHGWTHPPHAFASGDWLLVGDNDQRTQIYSITKGDLAATVEGPAVSASAGAGLFAVKVQERKLQFYSLPEAKMRSRLEFPSPILFTRFSADAKRFFVLTNEQKFYIFDTAALAQPRT